jgi:8-oxo-dGTP pyrophosphatase MutT (NUDIX family)
LPTDDVVLKFEPLILRLEQRLATPLPGVAAQALMAPTPRREWPAGFNPARVRHAAGLLLVFRDDEHGARVVLTVRADTLRHAGQVSLPGGVVETGETFEQTALREAHEEIGLSPRGVRVLGALTPLDIPVSGFRLYPVVAALAARPALSPSDGEVARILTPGVDEFFDVQCIAWRTTGRGGQRLDYPAFVLHGEQIWGATAMVLAEFLTLLSWPGPSNSNG